MEDTNEQATYTVNGEPAGEGPAVERAAPPEPTTEAEIEEFDRKAREAFDRELAKCYEIKPGSKEAEEAIRSAIRGE